MQNKSYYPVLDVKLKIAIKLESAEEALHRTMAFI